VRIEQDCPLRAALLRFDFSIGIACSVRSRSFTPEKRAAAFFSVFPPVFVKRLAVSGNPEETDHS
jgi:hypothetical protein